MSDETTMVEKTAATTLEDFVGAGWNDHTKDAAGVMARLPDGIALVEKPQHLPALAGLIAHVAGEHLGRFRDGIALLDRLAALSVFDPASREGKAVARSAAVLHRCAGDTEAFARSFAAALTGGGVPEASDRIRILAVAASALVGQKRIDEAVADFAEALALARRYGPGKDDPAARALAVTGNNLACELEERAGLSDAEKALMLEAARVGRELWAIAGGWTEVERAEYRLAMSHLKAGLAREALEHAARCAAIVHENGDDPAELFFAHEAGARVRLALGDRAAAKSERDAAAALLPSIADESFREYCTGELEKLTASFGPS